MAKVLVEDDCIDIRFGLLERVMLAERSRKLPLSSVRKVDPHPPLLDMMVHWADRSSLLMCGVSPYEGHIIPSACKPKSTLAIELCDEPQIFVELDDEAPEQVAARISRAMGSEPPPPARPSALSVATLDLAHIQRLADEEELEEEDAHEHALASSPEPAPPLSLDDDHDLTRLGGWLLGLGSLGVLTGTVMAIAGAIPGLLAVGAGIACAALGGVALAVVAHHQG